MNYGVERSSSELANAGPLARLGGSVWHRLRVTCWRKCACPGLPGQRHQSFTGPIFLSKPCDMGPGDSQLVSHTEPWGFPIFIASGFSLVWVISLHVWCFWYDLVCFQLSFVSLCPLVSWQMLDVTSVNKMENPSFLVLRLTMEQPRSGSCFYNGVIQSLEQLKSWYSIQHRVT